MPKSEKKDSELTDYQLFSRYAILNGMSMKQSAKFWNNKFKNKYSNQHDLINKLSTFIEKSIPDDSGKITPIFEKNYQEGKAFFVELKKRRRDKVLVNIRLVEDNYKCQFCGYSVSEIVSIPIDANALEVHHLYPLQDGERETKIQDLITLCPNCHRLIHAIGKK